MNNRDKATLRLLRGDCCCGCKGSHADHRSVAPKRPAVNGRPAQPRQMGGEDIPFVPPAPSYDSPQRPGWWGGTKGEG